MNWEIWLDKETGLPLKEINIDGMKTYYSDNKEENIDESKIDDYLKEKQDILIKSGDGITEFRYEFDVVTDEDVEIKEYIEFSGRFTIFLYSLHDDKSNACFSLYYCCSSKKKLYKLTLIRNNGKI